MLTIGELLKSIRGKDSLREASKKTGLSHNYISIVEKGVDPRSGSPIKPSPDTLRAYESGYNCSYDELMRVAGYIDGQDDRTPVNKLIEYLELELTDEEIMERMTFKIDSMTLDNEDVREFIAFVRAKRSMKSQHSGASNTDKR